MTAKLIPLPRSTPPALTDEQLVAATAAGDRDALAGLYDRHHGVVWRFIARSLGPNGPDADDLVQTVFLEAWRSAPRFAGRSTVRTWLLGIAHNLLRRHFRDSSRRRAALTVLANQPSPAPVSESGVHHRLMVKEVQDALQDLSPELRTAFVLCDMEQVRAIDAARILGVRPGTMWRRVHDARKRLRRVLQGETP